RGLLRTGTDQLWRQNLQFRHVGFRRRGGARHQRVLPQRGGRYLPHLFLLCPRPRHDERRLSLSRPDAAWAPRGRLALSDGLGAAARPVRGVNRRRRVRSELISGARKSVMTGHPTPNPPPRRAERERTAPL